MTSLSLSLEAALSSPSRLGWHYNTRNGEGPDHVVVADTSEVIGCVTVENGGGQRFPLSRAMIDKFASPAGMIWDGTLRAFIPLSIPCDETASSPS